jgi:hypothetical protein
MSHSMTTRTLRCSGSSPPRDTRPPLHPDARAHVAGAIACRAVPLGASVSRARAERHSAVFDIALAALTVGRPSAEVLAVLGKGR